MSVFDIVAKVLATFGVGFLVISSLGVVRLPDVFSRMHAAGKAATLGIGLLLIAAAFAFNSRDVILVAIFPLLLFFATAPVATTALARATHRRLDPFDTVAPRARLRRRQQPDDAAGLRQRLRAGKAPRLDPIQDRSERDRGLLLMFDELQRDVERRRPRTATSPSDDDGSGSADTDGEQ